MHLIVILVACHVFDGETGTNLYTFNGTDAEHPAQFSVQLIENRFSKTRRDTSNNYFNHTPCGIACS